MTFIIYQTCNWNRACNLKSNFATQITPTGKWIGRYLLAFDTLLPLTMLVVGILGATSVIPMGTAASYALIGTGAAGVVFSSLLASLFTKNKVDIVFVARLPFGL